MQISNASRISRGFNDASAQIDAANGSLIVRPHTIALIAQQDAIVAQLEAAVAQLRAAVDAAKKFDL